MSDRAEDDEEDARRLIVAIIDFLRDQLIIRTDLVPEDRDCLEIAIQCLEMAYGLEAHRYVQYRISRPLLDMFNQVTNPVSIRDKLRAEALKDEGNSYMRRNMFPNAETEYTNAIELDKWNAIYYCNRASSRIEQNNYFDAISDCRQALTLNPDYAKAHGRMGQAYALLNRPREAARCFRQALELEPENERYRNNLRVAENQTATRPDAMGLVASLLGSLLGLTRRGSEEEGSGRNLPSFMIITESHPPSREDVRLRTDSSQSDETQTVARGEEQNIVYPQPYGVVDEGSEEQPILQIDMSDIDDDEFQLDGLIFFQNSMNLQNERETNQQQETEGSQADEKTGGENETKLTDMPSDNEEKESEILQDVDSQSSKLKSTSDDNETGIKHSSLTNSDNQKKEEKIPDDSDKTMKAKEQVEEPESDISDPQIQASVTESKTAEKNGEASAETSSFGGNIISSKSHEASDKDPQRDIVEDKDLKNQINEIIEKLINEKNNNGLKVVSSTKTESDAINNAIKNSNSVEGTENESTSQNSVKNTLTDHEKNENSDMESGNSSFDPEKDLEETANKDTDQTAEKEINETAENGIVDKTAEK